ncbi:hypothetical protein JTB14_001348 [Gonioctena quinquepunctata]|nr:hypothetical protein JTB14_001348 [Gonioctena quinquepunctata]
MQLLNLTKDEEKQFSNFMGHTQKTHEEFYELPIDIYETAKVSELLLMMEKGSIHIEYKGKSLAEINFESNLEYAEEHVISSEGVLFSDKSNVAHPKKNCIKCSCRKGALEMKNKY